MSDHPEAHHLTLMPYPLVLIRIPKIDLDFCSKQLIRLAFFNTSSASFFSYTETEEEVSLILDENSRKMCSAMLEQLHVSCQSWRAIEIFEGPQALDQTGYICRFSEPLARQHVDMLYVSTYNTDLILVSEDSVERAVTGLQSVAMSSPAPTHYSMNQQHPKFALEDDAEMMQGDATDTHVLAKLDNELHLINFSASKVPNLTHAILQLFLFPRDPETRFFSYTCYGDQVTMIVDSTDIEILRPHLDSIIQHDHLWHAIHIQASAEGIDSSVVNFAARVLAENHIPIYYLSTMNDDFILVPRNASESALESLQKVATTPTTS